jgi:hypothetical protein
VLRTLDVRNNVFLLFFAKQNRTTAAVEEKEYNKKWKNAQKNNVREQK